LRSLVAELRQLEAEFGNSRVDLKLKVLSATTDPITLNKVHLGAFSIDLFWDRLSAGANVYCFDVVALDPNPATAHSDVTHPHVKRKVLCPGEARLPMQHALEQGRICDAFCLVRGVLSHYNPGSPHVPLDEWGGLECHDCGRSIDEDDCSCCPTCDHDFCGSCTQECAACEGVRCHGCIGRCTVCHAYCCGSCLKVSASGGQECCPRCLEHCPRCLGAFAKDQLAAETRLCPACAGLPPLTPPNSPSPLPNPENTNEPIPAPPGPVPV
jgi:hypothetical protein